MVGLVKTIIALIVVAMLAYCGATVKLGDHTFFEHVGRIWRTDETQELVDGVREESGPMVDKLRRGIQAGLDEASRDRDAGAEL